MNAAARLVHRGVVTRHLVVTRTLSRRKLTIFTLLLGVLLSALGMIYVTHSTRILHAQYQRNLSEQAQYTAQYSQLLLERSAWMMQSRVQSIAKNKLDMVVPAYKSMVIVHE